MVVDDKTVPDVLSVDVDVVLLILLPDEEGGLFLLVVLNFAVHLAVVMTFVVVPGLCVVVFVVVV